MPKHSISGSCHEDDDKEVPDSKFQKLDDPNIYQGLGVENSVYKELGSKNEILPLFDNICQSSSSEHLKLKNNYTTSPEKHQQKINSICRPLCKQNDSCDRLPVHNRIIYDSNRKQDESSVSTTVLQGSETKEHTVVNPQSSLATNETVIQENNCKTSTNSSSSTFCQDSNHRKETLNLGNIACQDAALKNKQKTVACDDKYEQDKILKVNCVLCQDTEHNQVNMGVNLSVPQSSDSTHDINIENSIVNKITDQTQEQPATSDNVKRCADHQMIKDCEGDLFQHTDHRQEILECYDPKKKINYFAPETVVTDITKYQNIDPIQKTGPVTKSVSQEALSMENINNSEYTYARKKIPLAEHISNKEIELKKVKLEAHDTLRYVLDPGDDGVKPLASNDYKKQSTSHRKPTPKSNICVIKGMDPTKEEVTDEDNEKQNFDYNHGVLQEIKPDTFLVDDTMKQPTDFRQGIHVSDNTVNNYAEPSQAEFRKELLSADEIESQTTLVIDDTMSLNIDSKQVEVLANNDSIQEALQIDSTVSQNTEPNQVALEVNCSEGKDTNPQQQLTEVNVSETLNPVSEQISCQIPEDYSQSSCQSVCSENAHASSSIKDVKISECDEPIKEKKKSVSFNGVTVYYFPRIQGFSCIPSKGGSTLGMDLHHCDIQEFSLQQHAEMQKRLHHHSVLFRRPYRVHLGGSDTDESEEVSDLSDTEFESENLFLRPVPVQQRRVMLRASGVQKIDSTEKEVCKDIRLSRELCGCDCKLYCDPVKCMCSQAGIKCQVDRLYFPCGCSKVGCQNVAGRIEFNPVRVQSHILTTLMRVQSEKQQEIKKNYSFASATKNTKLEVMYETPKTCLNIPEHLEENVDNQTSPFECEETFTCIHNNTVPLPECVSVQDKEIISKNALSKKSGGKLKEKQSVQYCVNACSTTTIGNFEASNIFRENHSDSENLTVIAQTVSLSDSIKVKDMPNECLKDISRFEDLTDRAWMVPLSNSEKAKDTPNESLVEATESEYLTVKAQTLPSLGVSKTKEMSNECLEENNSSGDLTITAQKVTSSDSPETTDYVVEIIKQNLVESVIA
ncbi:uncharacterized protein LOC106464999 [Limulus polyphemus]|uniref:Uncharacterized protein LOC106464999 n=1 Tax=Limulus polyphemus TaxID=6850 RepID=A0ABM1BEZ1_LIMPO|nr:uncharacterized protein LOC106464999 [Limulus polyphemus]XP_022248530.1 uncharacterized protein LOC106464999 [Limulus polyphemus]XP_022248531.1 uncharacterized protein LOC106464999 [Limulus polyphemus]